jgi:DNA (cytosine-5)-methyltransferase 1
MNELSLFTGMGGGVLGSKLLGWRTVGYVEWNEYCQKVLSQRIRDGIFDQAPIFGDIRAFIRDGYATKYQGLVDIITAGFPCQPFSLAGNLLGEEDDRNMWPETISCIRIIRPRFALLENVPGLLAHAYSGRIFGDLAESGYDANWCVFPASELGAPHIRERLFILAYSPSERQHEGQIVSGKLQEGPGRWAGRKIILRKGAGGRVWPTPDIGFHGMVDGDTDRVDRLRALGNGQVPAVVERAWWFLNPTLNSDL